jgi:hypothetical protein
MAKEPVEYGLTDALPASVRGDGGRVKTFTDAADANPGKYVTFGGFAPKTLGPIITTLRRRGYDAAQRSGVLYVKQG